MHAQLSQEGMRRKKSMLYIRILHVYNLVSIDTFTRMLNTFVTCSYTYQNIRETIVQML